MRKPFFSFLIVVLAAGTLAPTALAQRGMLNGTVTDDEGNPVAGAAVVAENAEANPPRFEQVTDERGRYSMLGLASGPWTVSVEAAGFSPNSLTVPISFGSNPPIAFEMARILHPLVQALGATVLDGLDPAAIQAEFEAADAAFNAQQWEQAVTSYRSLLTQLPMMNALHINIGHALRQQGQFEEAIASYELAVAGDPALATDLETEIARTRMAMGDFEGAGAALASAAGNAGASREDLYNLGEVEFAKGEIDTAADWYEKANAADPNWGKPLFKLALVALNRGDMDTAKQFFSQVIERDPTSPESAQAKATLDALP